MSYLCRNGHTVKHNHQAGLDCSKCKANERRRAETARKKTCPDPRNGERCSVCGGSYVCLHSELPKRVPGHG